MRIWHLITGVAVTAFALVLARDPLLRVFLIVFTTGLGEVALALAAVMALFQTVGAFGEARTLPDHAEAAAATIMVLALATGAMSAWMFAGICIVLAVA